MNNNSTRGKTRAIGISLAAVVLLALAAFGAIQALTPAAAEQIALDQYPGATVLQTEMDDENGTSVYSVELQADAGKVEVKIDPNSGTVLAADPDDDHEDAATEEDSASIDDLDGDQTENEQEGEFETED